MRFFGDRKAWLSMPFSLMALGRSAAKCHVPMLGLLPTTLLLLSLLPGVCFSETTLSEGSSELDLSEAVDRDAEVFLRVVRLSTPIVGQGESQSASTCATGFAIDANSVLTNAHVARSLCPTSACNGASIAVAKGLGVTPRSVEASVELGAELGSLDIAKIILEAPLAGSRSSSEEIATPHIGDAVRVIGFPGCSTLQVRRGKITAVEESSFLVDARTNLGGSGSIVVSEAGKLIGLVTQGSLSSASSIPFLLQRLGGSDFEVSVARLDVVVQLLQLPTLQRVQRESLALLSRYSAAGAAPGKSIGFLDTLDILSRTERMKRALLREPRSLTTSGEVLFSALSRLGEQRLVSAQDWEPVGQLSLDAPAFGELLALYSMELWGNPNLSTITKPEGGSQLAALRQTLTQARQRFLAAHAEEYGDDVALSSSFYSRQVRRFTGVIVACVLLFLIWLLSTGFVFARSSGGLFRRMGIAVLVALCAWPLSLVVWVWSRRNKGSLA